MKPHCSNHQRSPGPAAAHESEAQQSISTNHSQRGIALVITLVMLSVTLVMAIAFLALARRERSSVSTTTDTTTAKLAADSALAAAQSQILANVLSGVANGYNFSLLVSTNYINYNGFTQGVASPLNVNYTHVSAPFGRLNAADFVQNIANLQYLPRVPVFIQTNANGSSDFRYYLDLNRNGAFDDTAYIDNSATNGPISEVGDPQWVGILARPDMPHSANNQFLARYAFVALPTGNTLDINAIHNQTLNGSQFPNQPINLSGDGFFRNEGVGSWEINLAAFLADLNSDQWNPQNNLYSYNEVGSPPSANKGTAFEDAFAILTNRYAGFYASLAVPNTGALPPNISLYNALVNQGIDGYTAGTLMTGTQLPSPVNGPRNPFPWAGSDNTNHFYNLPSDLFNPSETSGDFVRRLTAAGNSIGVNGVGTNYDRYTFYHLLAQLGTDSDPDDGKMNLNYRNIDTNGVVVPNMETNCFAWSPLEFFTNAADRMLRLYTTNWFQSGPTNFLATYYNITNGYSFFYTNASGNLITYDPSGFGLRCSSLSKYLGWTNVVPGFGIANIPVYVNGQFVYSPAVNRVLQLAANLYDASTNSFYPSVFRPLFEKDINNNIWIVGYTNLGSFNTVIGAADKQLALPYTPQQLQLGMFPSNLPLIDPVKGAFVNVYGVPWIIGAKKGFPSFNKLGMEDVIQITRRLQIGRKKFPPPALSGADLTFTNQQYDFSISNSIGVECWNSYSNQYQNPVQIIANDIISMWITNNYNLPPSYFSYDLLNADFTVNSWPGYVAGSTNSFIVPINQSLTLLTNSVLYFGTSPPGLSGFVPGYLSQGWESNRFTFDLPHFGLITTNSLQLAMLDLSNGVYHVIDYVQLYGPQTSRDLNSAFQNNSTAMYYTNLWSTNLWGSGLPYGVLNQINASEGKPMPSASYWQNVAPTTGGATPEDEVVGFCNFLGISPPFNVTAGTGPADQAALQYFATNYVVQVPYSPPVTICDYTAWQANDPLVHYLASDLTFTGTEKNGNLQIPTGINKLSDLATVAYPSYSIPNDRYQPWGLQYSNTLPQIGANAIVQSAFGLAVKDPLVWASDYWQFPTNRYPNVGWIGRVHRGTPWQTVYLKAHDVLHVLDPNGDVASGTNTWTTWTGDYNNFDAANSVPVQDRVLFDLFTSRLNNNAAYGTLSVNQTNLAAWSALLSGIVVLTNNANFPNTLNPSVPSSIYRSILVPSYGWTNIQPAAVNATLLTILTNINLARMGTNTTFGFTNADGVHGAFEHSGDILSASALTENSPYLHVNAAQQQYGISDAVYEWLPQQIMGLVRAPAAPRYVIYGYGQSLRPAQNGLVSSGPFFGLVTNYQVVAESAVRAVVSVQAHVDLSGNYPVTNYTTRVESYNVLPSD